MFVWKSRVVRQWGLVVADSKSIREVSTCPSLSDLFPAQWQPVLHFWSWHYKNALWRPWLSKWLQPNAAGRYFKSDKTQWADRTGQGLKTTDAIVTMPLMWKRNQRTIIQDLIDSLSCPNSPSKAVTDPPSHSPSPPPPATIKSWHFPPWMESGEADEPQAVSLIDHCSLPLSPLVKFGLFWFLAQGRNISDVVFCNVRE